MKKLLIELPILAFIMLVAFPGIVPRGAAYALPPDAVGAAQPGDAPEKEEGTDPGNPRVFGIDGGYNGSYAQGTSPKSYYSQAYLNLSLKNRYVRFTAGISRFWDFQITNGAGSYETVNFTQPKVALSIYPHKVLELFGSYLYSAGDKTHYYKVHDASGGFNLDFDVVSLGFTGDYKKTGYIFKSDDRKDFLSITPGTTGFPGLDRLILMGRYKNFKNQNTKHLEDYTFSPAFSWYVIESTSLDLVYDYYHSNFENPYSFKSIRPRQNESIIFYSHTGKIGVSSETCKYFSLKAMITSGWSSDHYITAGGEIEGLVNLFDYGSISVTYAPVYNIAPTINPLRRKSLELRSFISLIRWGIFNQRLNVNPYMRLKNIGRSFWSHGISVNASFRY